MAVMKSAVPSRTIVGVVHIPARSWGHVGTVSRDAASTEVLVM